MNITTFASIEKEFKKRVPALKTPALSTRRRQFADAVSDFGTAKERIEANLPYLEGNHVSELVGTIRKDAFSVFDASEGRASILDVSEVAGFIWTDKDGKVKTATTKTACDAIEAAFARLQDAKDSGTARQIKRAREALSKAKAA